MGMLPFLLLWVFLILLLLILAVGALFLFLLPGLLVRAGCSLADVPEPRYLTAFGLGYGLGVINAGLGWLLYFLFWPRDPDPSWAALVIVGEQVAAIAFSLAVATLVYRLLLTPSFLKSVRIAVVQWALGALYVGLLAMVLMTAFSVAQMVSAPLPGVAPQKPAATRTAPAAVVERT